jgi:molybdopterin-guanine dinucleotide biosynthesis protein A
MLGGVNGASEQPLGAVLAGGAGGRIGGDKAMALLGGQPLIEYPLAAMRAVLVDVTIVAKPDTALPPGERVLREPARPRHPLVGIVHALRAAAGRSVLVCAADLPFITAAALSALVATDAGGAPAVVAVDRRGALQPLLAVYTASALELLEPAARQGTESLRAVVASLGPRRVTVAEELLFNVNAGEDLIRAETLLAAISRT